MIVVAILLLPKAFAPFIDWGAILAGYNTWLVPEVAGYFWFRETAIEPTASTVISLCIPFAHLFEEQFLVVLVLSPAHMENERLDVTTYHSSHVVLRLMIFGAAREKCLSKLSPDLYSKALPAYKF